MDDVRTGRVDDTVFVDKTEKCLEIVANSVCMIQMRICGHFCNENLNSLNAAIDTVFLEYRDKALKRYDAPVSVQQDFPDFRWQTRE